MVTELHSLKSDSLGEYKDSVYLAKDGVIYTYYFDNIKKKTIEFNPNLTTEELSPEIHLLIVPVFKQDSSLNEIQIREFSTHLGYVAFGKTINPNFEQFLNFESKLIQCIEAENLVAEYEATGAISFDYESWYNNLYNVTFNRLAVPVTVYKNLGGGDAWIHLYGQALFMMPSFNDAVSSYYDWDIYSYMMIYDKSFYRKKIATLSYWGRNYIYFWGPLYYLNDRMSSFYTL